LAKAIVVAGIKKKDLAKKVGVTPVMMSHYLAGKQKPSVSRAIKMAEILKVKVTDIFKEE